MVRADCFAKKDGRCIALVSARCSCCVFFKTVEQAEADNRSALRRIHCLPQEKKIYIADAYYGGELPEG